MSDVLARLAQWYIAQCDGEWEHGYGVRIQTLDNPGWIVKISLVDTPWSKAEWPPFNFENSETDWIFCKKVDGEYKGAGDPEKLEVILQHFLAQVGA